MADHAFDGIHDDISIVLLERCVFFDLDNQPTGCLFAITNEQGPNGDNQQDQREQ